MRRDCARSGAELLALEAGRSDAGLADVQYGHTDGVIDLTWGHPDPSVLASGAIAEAADAVLSARGWQALTYGAPAGASSVRRAVAEHLTSVDAPVSPEQIVITAGSSGGLDLVLSLLAVPGDVVLVEQPTYFLALRIFGDHGLEVVGLASDVDGPRPDELKRVAAEVRARGSRAFLYLVPTYANPTGRCLPHQRSIELVAVAAANEVLVIEDDVYRDTTAAPPRSLWSIDPAAVLRLGSFSKSLAPGLRVGYLTASRELAEQISGCGLLDSGGGTNHFAAMVVGEVLRSGSFAEIVSAGHIRYRDRRAALVASLDPELFSFIAPTGGFFVWLRLPAGLSSAQVVAAAREGGVLVSDGRPFFVDEPDAAYVRASFSMLDVELLREGAARLGRLVSRMCP